jgi:hypothetical protein
VLFENIYIYQSVKREDSWRAARRTGLFRPIRGSLAALPAANFVPFLLLALVFF